MAEAIKNMFNQEYLRTVGLKVQSVHQDFHIDAFAEDVQREPWTDLEMMNRIDKITETLRMHLPADYEEAVTILAEAADAKGASGYMFFPHFVAKYGIDHWETSMIMLRRFTPHASSEFAVRPFIEKDPSEMVKVMKEWASSEDEHVRRLASEGSRPRLPWGKTLSRFIKDPTKTTAILELLKEDPSKYVRKSVANHLNDFSKDHPNYVLKLAKSWQGKSEQTDWIIRHGCRTLIRKSLPEAYELFGYSGQVRDGVLNIEPPSIVIGESITMHYGFTIEQAGLMRVEYGIQFVKANGKQSEKKFLLVERTYRTGEIVERERTHSFADLSTRKHYPGTHIVTIYVNGIAVSESSINVMKK
ncbi:DNA alkylation repair protein [Geomicrobium sediminis]|uniref:3-methyladenine DNA glycosylase AlkC n=1 Tax=Geomicrobium sediminis TaxID=1347788 RepID=A0ABS2PC78_9BACL|nr:DNA alkylation repair protein [Geomicrobium sediminis]MBM7632892.1 3-methyladenine DNA glycosylase AlkC [Geomicrobium sediminis]